MSSHDAIARVMVAAMLSIGDGAQGGPVRGAVDATASVAAFSNHTYRVILRGGEPASVRLSCNEGTDLDVYVYDQDGTAIARDDNYSDGAVIHWTPEHTRHFRIEVVNRGSISNR
jgi:hypothetical protein